MGPNGARSLCSGTPESPELKATDQLFYPLGWTHVRTVSRQDYVSRLEDQYKLMRAQSEQLRSAIQQLACTGNPTVDTVLQLQAHIDRDLITRKRIHKLADAYRQALKAEQNRENRDSIGSSISWIFDEYNYTVWRGCGADVVSQSLRTAIQEPLREQFPSLAEWAPAPCP